MQSIIFILPQIILSEFRTDPKSIPVTALFRQMNKPILHVFGIMPTTFASRHELSKLFCVITTRNHTITTIVCERNLSPHIVVMTYRVGNFLLFGNAGLLNSPPIRKSLRFKSPCFLAHNAS